MRGKWADANYEKGNRAIREQICDGKGKEGRLIYGCEALTWYQRECDNLEMTQNRFGRWLWEVLRHELVRGESGWSFFQQKKRWKLWWIGCLG